MPTPLRHADEGALVVPPHFAVAALDARLQPCRPGNGGGPSRLTGPCAFTRRGLSFLRSGGFLTASGYRHPSPGGSLCSRLCCAFSPSQLVRKRIPDSTLAVNPSRGGCLPCY